MRHLRKKLGSNYHGLRVSRIEARNPLFSKQSYRTSAFRFKEESLERAKEDTVFDNTLGGFGGSERLPKNNGR